MSPVSSGSSRCAHGGSSSPSSNVPGGTYHDDSSHAWRHWRTSVVSALSKYGTTNAESGLVTTVYVASAPSGNLITSSRITNGPDRPAILVCTTSKGRPLVGCESSLRFCSLPRPPRRRRRRHGGDLGHSRKATRRRRAAWPFRPARDDRR